MDVRESVAVEDVSEVTVNNNGVERVVTLPGVPGVLSKTGWQLPEKLSFEEWETCGNKLRDIESGVLWWIGDWLNYGERKYGEMYSQALDATEYSYQTLRNTAWVAGRIELSRRRDNLSFTHHAEIAALEPAEQAELLDRAVEEQQTVRDIRRAARRVQALRKERHALEFPKGKYRILYADPPWEYGNEQPAYHTEQANHYPLMSTEEICALQDAAGRSVRDISEENAVLFLWTTSAMLPEALLVIEAWGFEYKTSFVWDKVKHNMGHYNSVRHELLLVCVRGSCPPDKQKLFDSVVTVERTEHSVKPEEFRTIIDTIYRGTRIELFARKRVDGWDVFGNE